MLIRCTHQLARLSRNVSLCSFWAVLISSAVAVAQPPAADPFEALQNTVTSKRTAWEKMDSLYQKEVVPLGEKDPCDPMVEKRIRDTMKLFIDYNTTEAELFRQRNKSTIIALEKARKGKSQTESQLGDLEKENLDIEREIQDNETRKKTISTTAANTEILAEIKQLDEVLMDLKARLSTSRTNYENQKTNLLEMESRLATQQALVNQQLKSFDVIMTEFRSNYEATITVWNKKCVKTIEMPKYVSPASVGRTKPVSQQ